MDIDRGAPHEPSIGRLGKELSTINLVPALLFPLRLLTLFWALKPNVELLPVVHHVSRPFMS